MVLSIFSMKWISWPFSFPILLVTLVWISIVRKSMGTFVYGLLGLLTPILVFAGFLFFLMSLLKDF